MSVPGLVIAGLESGPALDLAAGALLAGLGEQRAARPVTLGVDLPLWQLLYDIESRAPRALDPMFLDVAVAAEFCDYWSEGLDVALFVAVRPLLDSWHGVAGSRPLDLAARLDVPVVLVIDARDRGASAAAAAYGARALAGKVDIGALLVVGGEDPVLLAELEAALRRDVAVPVLGRIPPQLTDQFLRSHGSPVSGVRTVGARPVSGASVRLCREAAGYLQLDRLLELAAQRGYVPAVPRRVLVPGSTAGARLAVAWGPPLQPFALENIDVLQAQGVTFVPLNVAKDRELDPGVHGLLLLGQLDEQHIDRFAANTALLESVRAAVGEGLPTLALGGAALLCLQRLADSRGRSHELLGLVPAEAELIEWYDRPHYVQVSATRHNPYAEADAILGELFDLEFLLLEQESFAYQVRMSDGSDRGEGFVVGNCLVSTLYPSFAADPAMAERFVAMACARSHG